MESVAVVDQSRPLVGGVVDDGSSSASSGLLAAPWLWSYSGGLGEVLTLALPAFEVS